MDLAYSEGGMESVRVGFLYVAIVTQNIVAVLVVAFVCVPADLSGHHLEKV